MRQQPNRAPAAQTYAHDGRQDPDHQIGTKRVDVEDHCANVASTFHALAFRWRQEWKSFASSRMVERVYGRRASRASVCARDAFAQAV